jgi:hypothetical protein
VSLTPLDVRSEQDFIGENKDAGAPDALTHVILTRFNLATKGREAVIRTQPNWLAGRFDLFEKYCLPSVAAQTNQNFEWILFFDIKTPQQFISRIKEAQSIRYFHAYYTDLFDSSGWRESIYRLFGEPRTPALLTSILDSDDSLCGDYVDTLQKVAKDHVAKSRGGDLPLALNFTNGYVLSNGRLYAHRHTCNAFVNWLEPYDSSARTAGNMNHIEDIPKWGKDIQIDRPGAWLQVVHGGNVSNRIRGRLSRQCDVRELFPASAIADVSSPSWTEMVSDKLLREPATNLRDSVASVLHKAGLPNWLLEGFRSIEDALSLQKWTPLLGPWVKLETGRSV